VRLAAIILVAAVLSVLALTAAVFWYGARYLAGAEADEHRRRGQIR
jgi:hypothetical protein